MKNTIKIGGVKRTCRIYKADGGGDAFTVCFRAFRYDGVLVYPYLGFNEVPFHPCFGIAQHGESRTPIDGPHLGKRIPFESLNADCQALILQDLKGHGRGIEAGDDVVQGSR